MELREKIVLNKPIKDYDESTSKATEFMTYYDPDFILEILQNYTDQGEELEFERNEDLYKAQIKNENIGLLISVKVLKVSEDEFCVDFKKKKGQYFDFIETFKKMRDFCLKNKV